MIKGNKTYKILGKHGISTFLANKHTPSKALQWFDEENQDHKSLRYATNQTSIFEEDQKEPIILAEIIFEDGMLQVNERNPKLIKFLEHHPDNVANGGSLFKEINKAAEAEERDAILDLELDARIFARSMNDEAMRAIVRVKLPSRVDKMYPEEIKSWIKVFAMNEPYEFLSMVESPEVSRDNTIAAALAEGIIEYKKNKTEVAWNYKTRNSVICRIPHGEDADTALTRFLVSNKGKETFQEIEDALQN